MVVWYYTLSYFSKQAMPLYHESPITMGSKIIQLTVVKSLFWYLFVCFSFLELKFTDLDACSEYGYCSSDFSEDDINLFQGKDYILPTTLTQSLTLTWSFSYYAQVRKASARLHHTILTGAIFSCGFPFQFVLIQVILGWLFPIFFLPSGVQVSY